MKRVVLACLLASCGGYPNNDQELANEAQGYVSHYEPLLDAYARRLQTVYERSRQVPQNRPGADLAIRALVEAHDEIAQMRRYKNDVAKNAPERVAKHDHEYLQRLVEDLPVRYGDGCRMVDDDISSVESWMADVLRDTPVRDLPNPPPSAAPMTGVPEGVIP